MWVWIAFAVVGIILVLSLVSKLWGEGSVVYPTPKLGDAILISGAGTGIGKDTSLRLAERGYTILAGVYFESEIEEMKKHSPNIYPVRLDITDPQSVSKAFEVVSKHPIVKERGLFGLVNNAGIAELAPIEMMPFEMFRRVIEVNLLGHVRMTQVFLPLLRRSAPRARIVNTVSVAGRIAAAGFGAYAASKFGMEAVTDCLRRELEQAGISVSAVEPEFIRTDMVMKDNSFVKIYEAASSEHQAAYKWMMEQLLRTKPRILKNARPVSEVTDAMEHALTSPTPRTRYAVGPLAKVITWKLLSDRLVDSLLKQLNR